MVFLPRYKPVSYLYGVPKEEKKGFFDTDKYFLELEKGSLLFKDFNFLIAYSDSMGGNCRGISHFMHLMTLIIYHTIK
jgi:hypothetical protein